MSLFACQYQHISQLPNTSGHRTFSDNIRVIYNLRTLSVLALAALGLTIAGDLLGTHVAPSQGHIGFILRRVGAGIYGGLYILLVMVHLGAWTYRWHLKSYRRRVSVCQPLSQPSHYSPPRATVTVGYLSCPHSIGRSGCLCQSCSMVICGPLRCSTFL